MPRQDSKRGQPITKSAFEAPFETHITRFGVKGVNLDAAIDQLEPNEMARLLNITVDEDFGYTSRPGLLEHATSSFGTNIHSTRRLNDTVTGNHLRLHGVDGHLATGLTGAMTQIDTGYSGDPLYMVPYHAPQNGISWMYIGDSDRMRKVRGSDGLDLPIGLPAPATAPTAVKDAEQRTVIANFTDDGTQWSSWTSNKGYLYGESGRLTATLISSTPYTTAVVNGHSGSNGVNFQVDEPEREFGYYAFWGVAHAVDLSLVGTQAASDDDYIHLWMNMSYPTMIDEFRVIFVCSDNFDATVVPGTSDTANTDFYIKAFTANDMANFVVAEGNQADAAELARIRALRETNLAEQSPWQRITSGSSREAAKREDQYLTATQQGAAAAESWKEFSTVGVPLRRGDFLRVGSTTGRDWGTITGIIMFLKTGDNSLNFAVRVSDLYMFGGYEPDTGEAEYSKYDWRYTNYDPRSGAEGNPSPIMADANHLDTMRTSVTLTPAAYGDADVRQRFYRRGGSLPTEWQFLGVNSSDGGTFNDNISDLTAAASAALEQDNYQPVPSVDENGTTLLANKLPVLWGPLDDLLFGCGDKYRPGHVYFCKRGRPDSWPADHLTEVCSPSEDLMAGCMFGGQSFVFSRERLFVLYPNFSDDTTSVTSAVTQCKKGMVNRWGLVVGIGGIYFVGEDGVYRTVGGPEEWLSKAIDPLFRGKAVRGMNPIDFTYPENIRLEIHENELFFMYRSTSSEYVTWVYNIPFGYWRPYIFGQEVNAAYSDEGGAGGRVLLLGGRNSGKLYTHEGYNDDGLAIDVSLRTGTLAFGYPREEKRLGDQFLDLDSQGVTLTLTNYLNDEQTTNLSNDLTAATGRRRAIFDNFGDTPQRVRNISTELEWSSSSAAPVVYQLGTAHIVEPDITINRVTQWDDMNHADESYLTGVTFDCDTGGEDREIIVEYDFDGVVSTAATLTVNCDGRHKVKFSWTAVQAHKVRIRPNDDCLLWILYKVDWITKEEPPRIARWDIHFENGWDQYYTGLDLFCDTNGLDKTIEVYVDGTLVKTETVNTNGRRVHHITLPWGRGHVFRFRATDDNPGLLYEYRWHLDQEPSEQTNWNQNFTVAGTEADKYLKAIVFQCDTFGANKTVTVECDGVVVETLTINSDGRRVVQRAFPQHLGRVFRIYPTDSNPGRLYSLWWVFDQEPLALDRWETQEIAAFNQWHFPIYAHICLKSTAEVTLRVIAYNQSGAATTVDYSLHSTDGDKRKIFVGLKPTKGILYKYILTSADPFWLYREETVVAVREWGTDSTTLAHIFGNDDLDQTRGMTKAELAAARSDGTAS